LRPLLVRSALPTKGRFWAFHSYLFSNQSSENQGAFSAERLRKIAEVSGQDVAAWETCIADPAVRAEVEADAEEAKSLGITGTPTLVIGDWMESGIPAPGDLYTRIDEALGN